MKKIFIISLSISILCLLMGFSLLRFSMGGESDSGLVIFFYFTQRNSFILSVILVSIILIKKNQQVRLKESFLISLMSYFFTCCLTLLTVIILFPESRLSAISDSWEPIRIAIYVIHLSGLSGFIYLIFSSLSLILPVILPIVLGICVLYSTGYFSGRFGKKISGPFK